MMNEQIRQIQIYGERYSGTNFLQHLLEKNLLDISVNYKFGWKHFFINGDVENASDFLFIIIIRDPFDWLRSLYKHPYHAAPEIKNASFSQFIRHEWWCVWDEDAGKKPEDPIYGSEMMFERDPSTLNRFPNVIKLRTAKIKNWESLRERTKNHLFIRYEDLRENPEKYINKISSQFSLAQRNDFENITGYRGSKQKYKPKEYDLLSSEDCEFIINELDAEQEMRIGYNIFESSKNACGEKYP